MFKDLFISLNLPAPKPLLISVLRGFLQTHLVFYILMKLEQKILILKWFSGFVHLLEKTTPKPEKESTGSYTTSALSVHEAKVCFRIMVLKPKEQDSDQTSVGNDSEARLTLS